VFRYGRRRIVRRLHRCAPRISPTEESGFMKAVVTVTLKRGVLDPQGKAIGHALAGLGFDGVESVRQGKIFEIELTGSDRAAAEAALRSMAERLLANTVIEDFSVELR